jgi:hypothetical protein
MKVIGCISSVSLQEGMNCSNEVDYVVPHEAFFTPA